MHKLDLGTRGWRLWVTAIVLTTCGRDPLAPLGAAPGASSEICGNFTDDNHNGVVDEGCDCAFGDRQACWPGLPEHRHVGTCRDGEQNCNAGGEWGSCIGAVLPENDTPNDGLDQDCNGADVVTECEPEFPFVYEMECSDMADNDCDGQPDCADSDCAIGCAGGCTPQFPFFVEIQCTDTADNDCDGAADCADSDCRQPGQCGCDQVETACGDGSDNDCDGDTDCGEDSDCEACTPGSTRWCDTPAGCKWGTQTCDPNGYWGACLEAAADDRPPGCSGTMYDRQCCLDAGACCENYPDDHSSVGNCPVTSRCN